MGTLRYSSLAQMFFINCEREDFTGWYHKKNGEWDYFSKERLKIEAQAFALALKGLNILPLECVGIVAPSSPEWIIADVATQLNHCQVVPLFPNISLENFQFQCEDSKVKILIVNDISELDFSIQNLLSKFNKVICLSKNSPIPENGVYYKELLLDYLKESQSETSQIWLKSQLESIKPDDLFSIIYTSGSTGTPKGAELTHRNLIVQLQDIKRTFLHLHRKTDVCLVVLPVAHAFERAVVYFYILNGVKVYFADDPKNAPVIIKEIRPTVMAVVPRILECVYESMTIAGEHFWGLKKWFFKNAIRDAKNRDVKSKAGVFTKIYDKFIYSKMREAIGGRFRIIICGGGALSKNICQFMMNIGVQICEGYGLTECAPVVTVNPTDKQKPGSVGIPLTDIKVKIGENSEVLVKGDNVFKGYRNRPDLNAQIFTAEGYFKTGDQGSFDTDGYLFLTGRLKELLKTSTGKYVCPNPIEMELSHHPLIEQALVIANDRRFVSALLFLNPVNAKRFLQHSGDDFSLEIALNSKRVNAAIERHILKLNKKLNHWEQIRKWVLVGDELTVESGLLTPTLKIRRKVTENRYIEFIENMYKA